MCIQFMDQAPHDKIHRHREIKHPLIIYDLIFLGKGTPTKSLEEIETDLGIVEYACRKYVDCDDDEITFKSEGGVAYADPSTAMEAD